MLVCPKWPLLDAGSDRLGPCVEQTVMEAAVNASVFGREVTPLFRYDAENASSSGWEATVGNNLTAAGSGGDFSTTSPKGYAVFLSEGSRYFTGPSYDYGTDDMILEFVGRFRVDGGPGIIVGQKAGTSPFEGWELQTNSGSNGRFQFLCDDDPASTLMSTRGPGDRTESEYCHVIMAWDRSAMYYPMITNGAKGTQVNSVSLTDISSATSFALANRESGGVNNPVDIISVSLWLASDWFSSSDDAELLEWANSRKNLWI